MMQARGLVPVDRVQILDTGVVGPWREPRGSDPQRPLRIGYAGGIYPSKGVHVLIQAFTQLPPGTATLELHGVLEWFPSYVGHLKQLAGERADVRWHGRFAPDAIDAILAGLDLLVVPSLWYENRPLSIQAAFRCGVPVLSSDLGGLAELVEPGRGGERFPRGDVGALAQLLRELAADRPRLQALARARPRLPSMAEVAGRHLELYAAVANGNRLFPGGFLRYPDLP
jgi:glycosyltransferase involved in cell wall biosynthesis